MDTNQSLPIGANLGQGIRLPQDPIFVVGYPRSGTTLVQALLVTQEGVYSLPETHFFSFIKRRLIETDRKGRIEAGCLGRVLSEIQGRMGFLFMHQEIEALDSLAKKKELKPKDLFEYIVYRFIAKELAAERKSEKERASFRWLEKTPNHAYVLEDILSAYPRAQFLCIIRHPVPAIYSRKVNLPNNRDKALDWLVMRWRESVETSEAFSCSHPGKLLFLRYEDLSENTAAELERVCAFLGLSLDSERIENHPYAVERFVLTHETWKGNTRQKIRSTNDKYLGIVSKKDAKYIEGLLQDRMAAYGYAPFFSAR